MAAGDRWLISLILSSVPDGRINEGLPTNAHFIRQENLRQ